MLVDKEVKNIPEQLEVKETNWTARLILEELTSKLDNMTAQKANVILDGWLTSLLESKNEEEKFETRLLQNLLTDLSVKKANANMTFTNLKREK